MPRAFLYLYSIVVISILLIGWGLDKAWQHYFASTSDGSHEKSFMVTLEASTQAIGIDKHVALTNYYDSLDKALGIKVSLLPFTAFARSRLTNDIAQGQTVTVHDTDGIKITYKLIDNSGSLLQVEYPENQSDKLDHYYHIFLILFYSSIALAVFIWLWPLTRDLKRMEDTTQVIGNDGIPVNVDLPYSSTVYPLARAYNRSTEQIRNLIASHEEMSYAMSHELRTPLARMKFALEILRDDLEGLCKKENLATDSCRVEQMTLLESTKGLYSDVLQMDSLISELLNYASFERNTTINLRTGNLSSCVTHHIDRMTEHCAERGNTLYIKLESLLSDDKLCCDWSLLDRALQNLLSNASRYAQDRILIQLSPGESLESEGLLRHVEIRVLDDGPGIAKEDRDKVFKAFTRLRKQQGDAGSGFGLGLAIVKRIMTWHGGTIVVDSASNYASLNGACFIMRLPVR